MDNAYDHDWFLSDANKIAMSQYTATLCNMAIFY